MSEPRYRLCRHCDHFVGDNPAFDDGDYILLAKYVHLEDGEQGFDHDAEPRLIDGIPAGGLFIEGWRMIRPDLFLTYPDGKIGPNSKFHSRRGKDDRPRGQGHVLAPWE